MSQNFSGFRNILFFLLFALTLVVLLHINLQKSRTQNVAIRIGINHWPGNEFLFVAQKEGIFKDAGLDIEIVELSTSTAVRRAYQKNKIDGMATSLFEVLKAYKYSNRISKIVLVTDYSNGANQIISLPEYKSLQDLKGKTIGYKSSSVGKYLVDRALQLNKLNDASIMSVPLKSHQLANALTSRKVDAVSVSLHESTTINKLMSTNVVFNSSEIPFEIFNVIALDKKIFTKHPNLQTNFLEAWNQTIAYFNNNSEIYATLAERMTISLDEFKDYMNNIVLVDVEEQPDYLGKNGILENSLRKLSAYIYKDDSVEHINFSDFIATN